MKNLKLLIVLFLGIGLTFASCKKDDDDDGSGDKPTPEAKTCYVVKENKSDGSYVSITYNSDHKVISSEDFSSTGSLIEKKEVIYSDSKVSIINIYEDGNLSTKFEFKYSDKLDSAIMYMDTLGSLTKIGYLLYSYNGEKISKMSMFVEVLGQSLEVSRNEYIFSGENVSKYSVYELEGFSLNLVSILDLEYDDKINPYRNIGINDLLGGIQFMTKNNITKYTYKDADGNVDDSKSYNIVYDYNSDNYFTKYVETNFDNSDTKTSLIDYECE
jgi:hypothetical protein